MLTRLLAESFGGSSKTWPGIINIIYHLWQVAFIYGMRLLGSYPQNGTLKREMMINQWISDWWFGTCFFFHILGFSSSQLTNFIIFQRGRAQPPTRFGDSRFSDNPLFTQLRLNQVPSGVLLSWNRGHAVVIFAMRNKHHWHGSFPICLVMILVASIHDSTGVRWNTSSFLLEWFKSSIRCLLEIFGYNPSMVEPSFSKCKIIYCTQIYPFCHPWYDVCWWIYSLTLDHSNSIHAIIYIYHYI